MLMGPAPPERQPMHRRHAAERWDPGGAERATVHIRTDGS